MTTRATSGCNASLLDLHRELCAAVRRADDAFARCYTAGDAGEALQGESRYVIALAQAYAALRSIESRLGAMPEAVPDDDAAARLVS